MANYTDPKGRITYADTIPGGSGQALADELASRFVADRDGINLAIQNRGNHDAGANYDVNDLVVYSGNDFRALVANIGITPGTDPTTWKQLGGGSNDASTTNKGIAKLSVAPVSPTNPIAVGDNDPRNTNARTPTTHAATHKSGGADAIRLDELAVPTGSLSLNSQKITNLAAPTLSTDAARLMDVDAARAGLRIKDAVRAATTANTTLSGTQTIDGVALVAGDRVLVKDQTTGSQNGIYVVAAGAWARSTDADTSAEVKGGMTTWVNEGTANGDKQFTLTTNDPITLGTTALVFAVFSASGGVSSVNSQTGTVVLDGTNISDIDPTNGGATATLRTILSNLWANLVPKGLATASGLTLSTGKLLGRTTAATGAIEEISVGTGLALAGGVLSTTTSGGNTLLVNQTGHGFTTSKIGYAVTSSGTAGQFALALASSDAESQIVGVIVSIVDANNFVLGLAGAMVTRPDAPWVTGEGYYLSQSAPGFYTPNKPLGATQIQRFFLRAISPTQAIYEARTGIVVVVGNPPAIATVSASAIIAERIDIQEVNAGSTATTQTLPSSYTGKLGRITIKQLGTGTITMAAATGTTLEAGTITTQGTSLDYYLSGTVWRKI